MHRSAWQIRCFAALVVGLAFLGGAGAAFARQAPIVKTVRYMGYTVRVPRPWPVYDLRTHPSECVRFNRHAVYLGTPGSEQRCPAVAAGRTEAILIQPIPAKAAADGAAAAAVLRPVSVPGAQVGQGSAGELAPRTRHVLVTATWAGNPGLIEHALGLRSMSPMRTVEPPVAAVPSQAVRVRVVRGAVTTARAGSTAHSILAARAGSTAHAILAARAGSTAHAITAHAVTTGLGFDLCSTPSGSAMSAWGSSPYQAVSIYIGGVNLACSQPNLTAGWVAAEMEAGWSLIPAYVGLQAPGNSCGCQAIVPSRAAAQGAAAARDAVRQAASLGIGPGSPIYYDMENYGRSAGASAAVLTFLSAWTSELHAEGYESGVYSSAGSGITDLVSAVGTRYKEPNDVWIADWNGQKTTSDPYVPSGDWANHQRLHQFSGSFNATYGGVTLTIDADYLDGATADASAGAAGTGANPPVEAKPPAIWGNAEVGWTLYAGAGKWSGSGSPISYSYQWQRCSPACTDIADATTQTYPLAATDLDAKFRVLVTASGPGGTTQAASRQTRPVAPVGYWLYTSSGEVYNGPDVVSLGSPLGEGEGDSSIVGMAATMGGWGYWLASSSGRVYAFGDARNAGTVGHHVTGIVADPRGGYWLYDRRGDVYARAGARSHGSLPARGVRTSSVVGMAATANGRGYWLVTSSGKVYAFGNARRRAAIAHGRRVAGVVASPAGGLWLFTAHGRVFDRGGAKWYGSPAARGVSTSSIVGMAATANGRGYWLVSSSGAVYAFGNAAELAPLDPTNTITGIAGQP